jgi:S-sulfo-L-cysteine synthase (O-acetyl-L-serine-dependent)
MGLSFFGRGREKGVASVHVRVDRRAERDADDLAFVWHPLVARIGETPLVELFRVPEGSFPRVFAKLESANPGGSVKDRAASAIVAEAVRQGLLPARRLLDATSGNTGIAYAMLGAALGFGVTLCVPGSASLERRRILSAYGAEVIETDPLEGSDGAIRRARELFAERPDLYHYADQYSNPANPAAHERTTGPEILRQMEGRPLDLFVAGLGTSGTFVGVSRFLRRASPETRLVSVEPDGPFHGLEGLKHMASALVPAIYDPTLADARVGVRTEEAHEMARRLAREEGLFVGPSSGAAVVAALQAGREMAARTVAVVLPDGGDRYLSGPPWDSP